MSPRPVPARGGGPGCVGGYLPRVFPDARDALWRHRTTAVRRGMAAHIVAVIVGGLALDRWLGSAGASLATAWTVGVFAWLFALGRRRERAALVACLLIAGTGEALLALEWGLYDYRRGDLPWFVPPGHALLMTLGLLVAPRIGPRAVRVILLAGAAWAAVALARGTDDLGIALFGLALACAAASPEGRPLYAAMLVLALAMELYGTALGAWTWRPHVPGAMLTSANPPFAAGALYALLDLLVLILVPAGAPAASRSDRSPPMPVRRPLRAATALGAVLLIAGCAFAARSAQAPSPLGPSPTPAGAAPDTPAQVALGAMLFHDPRLSGSGRLACEGCHYRRLGWSDSLRVSVKDNGQPNGRHSPTLYNVGHQASWYWDGRATTLEGQVAAAWRGQLGADPAKVASALDAVPAYRAAFRDAFGEAPGERAIARALAAYLRTLNSGPSPWDRFQAGDRGALSAEAQEGWTLFAGKAGCAACHVPPRFADGGFHDIGLEAGKPAPDLGRFVVTKDPRDSSAFKTPTLRSVALSAPYFHDGSAATLEAAVRRMAGGGGRDPLLADRGLTDADVARLVAFLRSLTSDEPAPRPTLP